MDSVPIHPRLRPALALGGALAAAAEASYRRTRAHLRKRRPTGYALRPGFHTPFWNLLAHRIRIALRPYGAKARLARYLGVPRQRVTDFVSSRRRLPDAEVTLRLLHWLNETETKRDPSI